MQDPSKTPQTSPSKDPQFKCSPSGTFSSSSPLKKKPCLSCERSEVSGLIKELMKEQQNKMRDLVVEVELEEIKNEELVASMKQIVMDAGVYTEQLGGSNMESDYFKFWDYLT